MEAATGEGGNPCLSPVFVVIIPNCVLKQRGNPAQGG